MEIKENQLILYPRFQKKKIIDYNYITYRRVEVDEWNFYRIFRNPKERAFSYKITYFHDLEELIIFSTRLKNAYRLDANVIHHMIKNGYIKKSE